MFYNRPSLQLTRYNFQLTADILSLEIGQNAQSPAEEALKLEPEVALNLHQLTAGCRVWGRVLKLNLVTFNLVQVLVEFKSSLT